jgi:hypothetical protein
LEETVVPFRKWNRTSIPDISAGGTLLTAQGNVANPTASNFGKSLTLAIMILALEPRKTTQKHLNFSSRVTEAYRRSIGWGRAYGGFETLWKHICP